MKYQLKNYKVTAARFIGGQHRAVGELVKMPERTAKYYMEPHGTGLKVSAADGDAQTTADAEAQAEAEGAARKKRK